MEHIPCRKNGGKSLAKASRIIGPVSANQTSLDDVDHNDDDDYDDDDHDDVGHDGDDV